LVYTGGGQEQQTSDEQNSGGGGLKKKKIRCKVYAESEVHICFCFFCAGHTSMVKPASAARFKRHGLKR
jgi:hypothetical protein